MATVPSTAASGSAAAATQSRAVASSSPSTGSINILAMASGFSSATVSISTPPSLDAIRTGQLLARSIAMPR